MSKHAKSNRRLQKAAVLSTAALVLPVLGTVATPAYAEAASAQTSQSAQSDKGQGAENRSERADEAQAAQASDNRSEQAAAQQQRKDAASSSSDQDAQAGTTAQSREDRPAAGADDDTQTKGPDRTGDNNTNAQGNGANTDGPFNATPTKEEDEGEQVKGSRGKADDKNPPGQVGNTRDSGYECDDNSGIGDGPEDEPGQKTANRNTGNPAHTGCGTTGTTPVEKPVEKKDDVKKDDDVKDEDEDVKKDEVVVRDQGEQTREETVTTPVTPQTPTQQVPAVQSPAEVLNAVLTAPPAEVGPALPAVEAAAVLPQRSTTPTQVSAFSPSALPFTGAESGVLALVALASVAVGGGMVVVARRVPA